MKSRREDNRKGGSGDASSKATGVDSWISKLKRHPITGAGIFLCVVLIALGNVVDAGAKLSNLLEKFKPSPARSVQRDIQATVEKRQHVNFDAAHPFQGYWSLQFFFVGDTANRADTPRPWFNWGADLKQTNTAVVGSLRAAQHSGKLEAEVAGNQLTGRIKFSWGEEWWRSFRLTLDNDGQTATGTAMWEFKDGSGAHLYEIKAQRLPER